MWVVLFYIWICEILDLSERDDPYNKYLKVFGEDVTSFSIMVLEYWSCWCSCFSHTLQQKKLKNCKFSILSTRKLKITIKKNLSSTYKGYTYILYTYILSNQKVNDKKDIKKIVFIILHFVSLQSISS